MVRIGVKVFEVCWSKDKDPNYSSLALKLEKTISDWLGSFPIACEDKSKQIEFVEVVNVQQTIREMADYSHAFVMIYYRYEIMVYELKIVP